VLVYVTTHLELPKSTALNAVLIGSAIHFFAIPLWGALSDRLGRRPVTLIGSVGMAVWAFAFFALLDTESFAVITLSVTAGLLLHGAMYGPQAAFISEMFDTKVRYSGASMGSQLASIVAGALAPIIAVELLRSYESSTPIALYLCAAAVVTTITVAVIKETRGRDLTVSATDSTPAPRRQEPSVTGTDLV
jgi:MFS family permease